MSAAIAGPKKASTGPKCGMNCNPAARIAQNGANGTCRYQSPAHHRAPMASEL